MNLSNLFDAQRRLDERIIEEKELEGQDLLPNIILASLVELAECANEWRGFKHWSNDQEPRPKLLEEFVDKFHFVLSIGNQLGFDKNITSPKQYKELDLINQFIALFHATASLRWFQKLEHYVTVFNLFLGLGEMLGFTWDQIEQAYFEKNKINHQRQESGY